MSSIQNATSSVSSVLRPEAGSSSSRSLGCAHSARQLHHLAHAVGQAGDALLAIVGEVEEVDDLLHRVAVAQLLALDARREQQLGKDVGARAAVAADQQVLQHRGVLEQLDVLKGAGDTPTGDGVRRHARDVRAVEHQPPAGRLVDAADQVEDGALAGAVRADDGEDLALLHVEGHSIHGPDAAEGD